MVQHNKVPYGALYEYQLIFIKLKLSYRHDGRIIWEIENLFLR